ncbi:actin binding protein [Rhizina undulata]
MSSLDIAPQIGHSYQKLVSSPPVNKPSSTYAQWAVFSISTPLQNTFIRSSKASTLNVHSTGEGELENLLEEFNDGKVQFAFVKVKDTNTGLAKFVLIAWCGEGVPERVRGYFTGYLNTVSKVLHGYHVQITARSESDLSPDSIMQKVANASGAKYSSSTSSSAPPPAPKPTVTASKPVYQPTRVTAGISTLPAVSRAQYKRDETDSDGWGADAPPVSRSQIEKVAPAYKPTRVDINAIRAQPSSTTSGGGYASHDKPEVVRGTYQPIGRVDITALRAQAKEERPEVVKGAYQPVGKVDMAALKSQGQQRKPDFSANHHVPEQEDVPKSLAERSAAFSKSERLTELPKPKPAKKFVPPAPRASFGTKPPAPGGFGTGPSIPTPAPVGTANRDFGSSGGKTPAQLWAEKKARERGDSGASETVPPTMSPGYTGQSGSASQQFEEEPHIPSGGVSAIRNKFVGGVPMGSPASPKSPQRTGGLYGQHTGSSDRAPPPRQPSPPAIDTFSRPSISKDDDHVAAARIPQPPPQPPRSPSPPTPDIPGSPVRIIMPVARTDDDEPPVARYEPEPQISMPTESLSRVVPREEDLPEEEPARDRGAVVGAATEEAEHHAGSNTRAIVVFDYEAAEGNEIDLVEGQIVDEIDKVDEDWWAGRNQQGKHGLFPSNYVELIEEDAEEVPPPLPAARPAEPASPVAEDAPVHAAAAKGETAVAIYDYEAAEGNEISFPEGAIIENIEFPDEDWWLGSYGGKEGLFPANYVELQR